MIADTIRQYILDKYTKPARDRGETTITIRSGELHSRMGFYNRLGNVCQVLRGSKLLKTTHMKLLCQSSSKGGIIYFTYLLEEE